MKGNITMNAEKIAVYRMSRTQNMPNMKELIGKTVTPTAAKESEYTDGDGILHIVLAVEFANVGCYRTEVAAFIENFRAYWEVFADEDEKPALSIVGKSSKRGNTYVNFEVVG